MNKCVLIDGNSLSVEEIYRLSNDDEYRVALKDDADFKKRIEDSRTFLESYLEHGYPVYGVTTGFGDSSNNHITARKTEELQRALINFHGIGVGKTFSIQEARAIMAVRLNSNVKGYSAIRYELAEKMVEFFNNGIFPVIPELGSVGASGDLTPLSYLAAALIGERKVYYGGEIVPAGQALKKANVKPITLKAKESLALMNGTSVMSAVAGLAWSHAHKLSVISDFITAATVEVMNGNDSPYRALVSEVKNHKGQIESAKNIRTFFKGSKRIHIYEDMLDKIGPIQAHEQFKKNDLPIQDRYSLRCAPQINGVLKDTLDFSKTWIEDEINSVNDNPLVDGAESVIYNSGNFYGGHISLACDYLRIAVANIADLSEKQAELIIDGKFNNLTENLIPFLDDDSQNKGLYHGFKAALISISAICAEIQFLTGPVSIHSRPTESLNQDKVSLGTISARRLREQIDLLYRQYSIHLLALLQAVDLIGCEEFSETTQKVYARLRTFSSFVNEDRPLDQEADLVYAFLKNEAHAAFFTT